MPLHACYPANCRFRMNKSPADVPVLLDFPGSPKVELVGLSFRFMHASKELVPSVGNHVRSMPGRNPGSTSRTDDATGHAVMSRTPCAQRNI
eukprot:7486460-Pyramimonas_sp.AAC.1